MTRAGATAQDDGVTGAKVELGGGGFFELFSYDAIDADGRCYSGHDETRTPDELAQYLHGRGHVHAWIRADGRLIGGIDERGPWSNPDIHTVDPGSAEHGAEGSPSRKPAVRLSPAIRADIERVRAERRAAAAHEAQRREQQRAQTRSHSRENRGRER